MNKVKLIAGKYCHYGVGIVPEGEAFEAPERDAHILVSLKRARRAATDAAVPVKLTAVAPVTTITAAPVTQPVTPHTDPASVAADESADTKADPETNSAADPELGIDETQPRQKRPYKRRDMQAEK